MRNFVAKHDFNRASVHPDRKKGYTPDINEELDFYDLEENSLKELKEICEEEYRKSKGTYPTYVTESED